MALKRKATWLDVAVSNGGFRNAIKALNWAHSWVHVQVALGRDPSVSPVSVPGAVSVQKVLPHARKPGCDLLHRRSHAEGSKDC